MFLTKLLEHSAITAKKVMYFGSSSVYGDHQGAWVNEQSTCNINNSRQTRRLDAEQQWLTYCKQNSIQPILLRIAGIYGPHRLPTEAAKAQTPLIEKEKAPYTNHIYIKDLAAIAYFLASFKEAKPLYNIADGHPQPMGTVQQQVAKALGIVQAPYESWIQAWERASPMKKEFMQGSKRLNIELLKRSLGADFVLNSLNNAIQHSLIEQLPSSTN